MSARTAVTCVLSLLFAGAAEFAVLSSASAACNSDQPSRTPSSRYLVKGDEVYDKKTDLTWQHCSVGQHWKEGAGCVGVIKQMTWDEAKSQAQNGWRLPSKDELTTLLAPNCSKPAINEEIFPDLELDKLWYWTSSENGSFLAWLVNFADGNSNSYDRTDTGAVRLVRGGS
jgi:Protein of unknown function (DUF1566)